MPKTIDKPRIGRVLLPEQKERVAGALQDPMASMRALVKGSLFLFIKYFWDTYTQEDKFIPNWHIEKLCEELEGVARSVAAEERKEHDLIINVPPGTTKTATVSIMFPVWCWVNWYHLRFIASSHGKELSNESAEYCRNIVRSDKFRKMFPDLDIQEDKDVKSNFRVVKKEHYTPGHAPRIKQGGGRVSTSVDARIIGFHAHIIIIDDIIDPKRALSEVGLKTAQDHMKTLATRKVNKRVTVTVMIMQRLHQDDPTGYMLKKQKKRLRHICLPGYLREYAKHVKPEAWKKFYVDDLLDVNRLGWDELEELEEDLGQYGFAGQVGQSPTPPGGGMFKVDRMAILDHLTSRTNIVKTIRYWDKAATALGGAYTAGVKMSLMPNKKVIIEDVVRKQLSAEDREATMLANAEADHLDGPCNIHIEQEPGSGGKESAQSTIRNMAGFACFADLPTGKKEYRADPFSVAVNNGNVILIKGDWNKGFKEELELFPNGTYKDQTDAASAAYNILTGKRMVRIIR